MTEEPIPQFASSSLETNTLLARESRHVIAVANEFQTMLSRQLGDELLVRIRLRSAQLVIEMNDGENDPQFSPHLQQQPQQSDRINAARNGDSNAVSSLEEFLLTNLRQHAVCEAMHANMVQQRREPTADRGDALFDRTPSDVRELTDCMGLPSLHYRGWRLCHLAKH